MLVFRVEAKEPTSKMQEISNIEDRDPKFFRNVSKFLADYTMSHLRK
jgi:hypothetical protein